MVLLQKNNFNSFLFIQLTNYMNKFISYFSLNRNHGRKARLIVMKFRYVLDKNIAVIFIFVVDF